MRDIDLLSALGDESQAMALKADRRDLLLEEFREVIMGARAFGETAVAGIAAKFKIPEPRTEQNLIAGADSFYAETASPLEEQLIEVGLNADFRQNI